MSIWDDPAIKPNSDYVRFETIGDSITGEVLEITIKTWDDGSKCPSLLLCTDSGEQRTLTAGQRQLIAKLAEHRPEVGDRIAVVYTGISKLAGGKTAKSFDVTVKRGQPSKVAASDLI